MTALANIQIQLVGNDFCQSDPGDDGCNPGAYITDLKKSSGSETTSGRLVFSPLIESQLTPLLRIRAQPYVESYVAQLTARGAGTVTLESMDVSSIVLGASSGVIEADFSVSVKP